MPNQQTLKFTIRQDGYVTEEATGFTSHQCVELTESIEKKLGTLETRQFKPEFYSNNVSLQLNQNETQEQTTTTGSTGDAPV
tara:strand:- start:382 stop:627 length:246 start_codon:yes stop_codon:yes gene_type:complete